MPGISILAGAGAIGGAFLARLMSEMWPAAWWLSRPIPVAIVASALGILAAWAGRRRISTAAAIPFYLLSVYLFQPAPNPLQAIVLVAGVVTMCAWSLVRPHAPRKDRAVGLALFFLSLAVYLSTLTPAVGTRDGYELQAISATLGFAHPTGYPLFPLLGRLWIALFPIGSIAWRINVLCALFAAASVPFVYATARRVLGQRTSAAWAALLFAFSHTFWTQAVRPEKYTLNALFVSILLYLVIGMDDPGVVSYKRLRLLGLVYGLSLTHHRTMLMLAPALALYLLWRNPTLWKRPREWLPALGIALAPLLLYLYIPWRAAAQGWFMTPTEFLEYIAGAYYGPAVRPLDWLASERAGMFWRFVVQQFGYPGVALGLLGLATLLRKRPRFAVCTAAAYLAYYVWGTVWYAYYNDVNSFIPNHMILSIWIGGGVAALMRSARLVHARRVGSYELERGLATTVLWSIAALLPMWLLWTNAPVVDASDEWNLTNWGAHAIDQELAPSATILADREKHPPLDYLARIEKKRPDLDVVILSDEGAYLERLRWDIAQGRTVYLARFLPGLEATYHLRSRGPLVEVGTQPRTEWPDTRPVAEWSTHEGETIQLLQHTVVPAGVRDGRRTIDVDLIWRATAPVPGNYQVTLRLIGPDQQISWQATSHPVNGMYPTAAWRAGEIIPDWHEIVVDDILPSGAYTLTVGLFPPFSGEGLPLVDGQSWLSLGEVLLDAPARIEIAHSLRATIPGRWQLLGYDLPRQVPPAGRARLVLYWRLLGRDGPIQIGVRMLVNGQAGEWQWSAIALQATPASQPAISATTWTLTMPPDAGQGTVQIAARIPGTGERLVLFPNWLGTPSPVLSLPPIAVAGHPPTAPGTANFDDRILLSSADIDQKELVPGSPLTLRVRWQCIRAVEEDYTLFVHLLGPDGTLKGQIDVWPRNGTHPTSAWREGEVIEDMYTVYLDRDAPPGAYQVEIGWYLLETMQRLPLLDESGQVIDDRVLLPAPVVGD